MKAADDYRKPLLKALENRGWIWQGDTIYAPHKMLWFGKNPDFGNLAEFHERWQARVERIIKMKPSHDDPQQHQQVVEDNQSLVSALEELLNEDDPAKK